MHPLTLECDELFHSGEYKTLFYVNITMKHHGLGRSYETHSIAYHICEIGNNNLSIVWWILCYNVCVFMNTRCLTRSENLAIKWIVFVLFWFYYVVLDVNLPTQSYSQPSDIRVCFIFDRVLQCYRLWRIT